MWFAIRKNGRKKKHTDTFRHEQLIIKRYYFYRPLIKHESHVSNRNHTVIPYYITHAYVHQGLTNRVKYIIYNLNVAADFQNMDGYTPDFSSKSTTFTSPTILSSNLNAVRQWALYLINVDKRRRYHNICNCSTIDKSWRS